MSCGRDPFERFRHSTRARIGLGRAGDALPTSAILDFQLAHARARDAVHGQVNFVALAKQLAPVSTIRIRSCATDRTIYLSRPDLGRQPLAADLPMPGDSHDIAFVIADGLSASAVERHAVPLFKACMKRLGGFSVAPVILGEQARVAFGDEAAAAFGAEVAIVLIGERPGLSVPDSLGAYITFRPQAGRRDSERNCISNIHADGLGYEIAADKIAWIVREALRLQLSGVALKEGAESSAKISSNPGQE
ncbi:ethanolamine ammonia-lyase subunit EutC [Agrobacterium tumefaciens]|uniref:Ethanolamine ammonia-lyase small subunit n=2 Tax=Rhizobium/Agrobacterium group TaxID=227290 RepID=Q9KWC7_RHIRH|nr:MULTISPECIES: ethanolamine ammonia-lyase subunit EutC [Rhizobium/Agrobacterium group]ASK42938.1 ethanolamine ammonia-lyase [Rhizobium rhizogenes]MCZ7977344.1 ethanolamine ammonia-lyase subunit EutC [Agrobacterium salinitolerans]MDA5243153.1 ethanolamine ammonia-lyase subunit EutC [Agrobacterium sp. MAFF310724]MDA5247665.1 ethanolamine ammonia-lyase subunit EutC [Agrobacterium sp. MAFF210268]TRB03333.1 ethanolamine ammonia-lyase subunit EutC [Agrobacterium tumefaciens]